MPSLRFGKGGVEETVFNLGLARPVSDNNLTVHALMSANIQLLVQLIRSREVLIQVDQSTKDVKDAYVSFICFLLRFHSHSQQQCAYLVHFVTADIEGLVHQSVVECGLLIVHRPPASLMVDILPEVVVGMEVDVEVVHNVAEEAFDLFCRSDMCR